MAEVKAASDSLKIAIDALERPSGCAANRHV